MAEIKPEQIDTTLHGSGKKKKDQDSHASTIPKGVVLDEEGKPYATYQACSPNLLQELKSVRLDR